MAKTPPNDAGDAQTPDVKPLPSTAGIMLDDPMAMIGNAVVGAAMDTVVGQSAFEPDTPLPDTQEFRDRVLQVLGVYEVPEDTFTKNDTFHKLIQYFLDRLTHKLAPERSAIQVGVPTTREVNEALNYFEGHSITDTTHLRDHITGKKPVKPAQIKKSLAFCMATHSSHASKLKAHIEYMAELSAAESKPKK